MLFKINTTVCALNHGEDMGAEILELAPCRWKVFQCLLIDGENAGPGAIRRAEDLVVSNDQFAAFLARHSQVACLVAESNVDMRNSYLILDERMRFLNNLDGRKVPGPSVLDVGVASALDAAGFDEAAFKRRGGLYKWSKDDQRLQW